MYYVGDLYCGYVGDCFFWTSVYFRSLCTFLLGFHFGRSRRLRREVGFYLGDLCNYQQYVLAVRFLFIERANGYGHARVTKRVKLSSLRRMFVKNFNRGSVCTFLRRFTVGVLCLLWYLWLDPDTRDFLKELVLFSTWFQGLEPETQNLLKDVGALHWQDYKVFYLFSFPGFYLVVALLEADLISLRCAKCILFLLFLMTILWGGHLGREFYTLVWKVLTIPSPFKSACTSIFIFFFYFSG